jgi:FixJ family two-component response regulator
LRTISLLAQLEPDFAPPRKRADDLDHNKDTGTKRFRQRLPASTWQAFRQLMRGDEAKTVALALGLSVNSVLLARSRILKRLREAAQDMTD